MRTREENGCSNLDLTRRRLTKINPGSCHKGTWVIRPGLRKDVNTVSQTWILGSQCVSNEMRKAVKSGDLDQFNLRAIPILTDYQKEIYTRFGLIFGIRCIIDDEE